jgi:hypothetical protein
MIESTTNNRPYKIIVTGDREWSDVDTVYEVLRHFPPGTILIHGDCQGLDTVADLIGRELGFDIRVYPYPPGVGRRGGPMRNTRMAVEHPDTDEVIAFHPNIEVSRGTRDMYFRARTKYLPFVKHRLIRGPEDVIECKDEET